TIGRNEIAGSVTNGHFCGQPDTYTVYFDARFDRPFTTSGTWGGSSGTAVHAGATSMSAHSHPHVQRGKPDELPAGTPTTATGAVVGGGYVTFDTRAHRTVNLQ